MEEGDHEDPSLWGEDRRHVVGGSLKTATGKEKSAKAWGRITVERKTIR